VREEQDTAALGRPVVLDLVNGLSCGCVQCHCHADGVVVVAAPLKENLGGTLDGKKSKK
jgi:hypothetical protein